MNGVLVIDKPAGPTSHDVVALVRRALGEKRIGHTGTLDPLATGVLALLVGRATRLSQFLVSDEKEYVADVRLGIETATYDAEGLAPGAAASGVCLEPEVIDAALAGFRGTYLQTPPPYSAKKVGGRRSYELARKDAAVELAPVSVTVSELERLPSGDSSLLRLRIGCTSGFYVRTLAHELGQALGCGAHLEQLRRTRAGEFTIGQAVPLQALQAEPSLASERLVSIDLLLGQMPAAVVNERGVRKVQHGNLVGPEDLEMAGLPDGFPAKIRLLDGGGRLLAVAERRPGGLLHPSVVLV